MRRSLLLSLLLLLLLPTARGQDYKLPAKAIVDIVDAPATPSVSIDPRERYLLLMEQPALPPISELAQPELRLAGARINPRTNGPSRTGHHTRFVLEKMADRSTRPIEGFPEGARLGAPHWSPDASKIALAVTFDDRIELWLVDVETAKASSLGGLRLNAAAGSAIDWMPDSKAIVARVVCKERGAEPAADATPKGPTVQETKGTKAPSRTFQDLLKNAHDEALFDHYFQAQLVRVELDGKTTVLVGGASVIEGVSVSPDGRFLLVETLLKPYSYLVPSGRFPREITVLKATDGSKVATIAKLPLAEEISSAFNAVAPGPRGFGWRADAPATLHWVEAQDGGDPKKKADIRDAVFLCAEPFDKPVELVKLAYRYSGISWGSDDLALVSEGWWENRKTRTWIVKPGTPGGEKRALWDRSTEDRYSAPGSPVTRPTPSGRHVLRVDNGKLLLVGDGASPEGLRPFLDELDLASLETKRLWRSEPPHFERVSHVLADGSFIQTRESESEPTNFYVKKGSELTALTSFPHPTPSLKDVKRELIKYKRADGVELNGKLYVPPGWKKEDGPLPVLIWAYPAEFKSASAASQMTDSPFRFTRIGAHSPLLLLTQGYAILENPTMPIVGEGSKEPNDTYVEQLVASAKAAVDELVRLGVGDPERMAIAGHSYGAFMTANLLAHSNLFRAGIARSGAYNRTLTPFGFQSEERTLWQAPEVYARMSPFTYANAFKAPILLIHGEADNNPGTFTLQSERLYQALKGHGATARLVLLPCEAHGYQARESVLHVHWEMTEWLDKYVKNAKPRKDLK